ncbi:DMT family transporter [Mesorhizobium sp. CAU 1741]|uniref:DMT family transporter n=1 Tax=Mesorhizobium sp. CAU 1741 TaxID=3140366 RepID=UPI00325AAA08
MSPPSERLAILQGLGAVAAGVGNNALIATLATLPVLQIVLLRAGGAILILLPVILWTGWRRPSLFSLLRAGVEASATLLLVFALVTTSLSLVATIMMAIPIGVMCGAALVLGERLSRTGQVLVCVGFAGAAIATTPTFGGDLMGGAAALGSAALFVLRDLMTRRRREFVSALEMSLTASLITLVFALVAGGRHGWLPIDAADMTVVAGMIVLYVASNLLIVAATRNGRPALVATTRYSTVVWAMLVDILVFAHFPHPATLAGAALIIACGLGLMLTERRRPGA